MKNKIIILLLLTTQTNAEPVIIYDTGKTIDATKYYPFDYPSADELIQQTKKYEK